MLARVLLVTDHGAFDIGNDRMRAIRLTMDHQPARTFRNPHPHHEHDQAEHGTGEIRKAPAEVAARDRGIEQQDRARCTDCSADPETAVDQEVGPAAVARRHKFLDGRIDRGVLAADAGTGQKPEQRIARDAPRQRGGGGRREIDRKRGEEQFLASEPVGQPAEAQCAQHRAGKIEAVGEPNIEIGEMKRRAFLQRTG